MAENAQRADSTLYPPLTSTKFLLFLQKLSPYPNFLFSSTNVFLFLHQSSSSPPPNLLFSYIKFLLPKDFFSSKISSFQDQNSISPTLLVLLLALNIVHSRIYKVTEKSELTPPGGIQRPFFSLGDVLGCDKDVAAGRRRTRNSMTAVKV